VDSWVRIIPGDIVVAILEFRIKARPPTNARPARCRGGGRERGLQHIGLDLALIACLQLGLAG